MITGGGVAEVANTAPYSANSRFSTGDERIGWVVAVNEASDQAVLFLEDPVAITPLPVARRAQIPGTVLYFEGDGAHALRVLRPASWRARVEHARIDCWLAGTARAVGGRKLPS